MPISFSLRSVAWLGVPRSQNTLPSGGVLPQMSADLTYSEPLIGGKDEIQYLVHGCPQVAMVSACKGDADTATFYGPAGEVLYSAAGGVGFGADGYPTDLPDEVWENVAQARGEFARQRAAGRLR